MERKVVFDLDQTLVLLDHSRDPYLIREREGAMWLLNQLRSHGVRMILWTGAHREHVERVFRQLPKFRRYFDEVITRDDVGRLGVTLVIEREFLGQGGKLPLLVGASVLIEDYPMTIDGKDPTGCLTVNAESGMDEEGDQWAQRVAQAVLAYLGNG